MLVGKLKFTDIVRQCTTITFFTLFVDLCNVWIDNLIKFYNCFLLAVVRVGKRNTKLYDGIIHNRKIYFLTDEFIFKEPYEHHSRSLDFFN